MNNTKKLVRPMNSSKNKLNSKIWSQTHTHIHRQMHEVLQSSTNKNEKDKTN